MDRFFSWETMSGESVRVGEWTITPQSQVLQVRLPFGGFVWHRPVRVVVERGGSGSVASRTSQTISIPDVTRQALWAILGLSIVINLLLSRSRNR